MPSTEPATLAIGALGRPHGIRGEVVFHAFNPDGARLFEMPMPLQIQLRRGSASRDAMVRAARPFQSGALVRLEGVDTRDAAAAVTGYHVCVPRAALPPLGEDEFYTHDLVGCTVLDIGGRGRGRVVSVFWNGHHEVLSVVNEAGEELMVPALREFLSSVDLAQRTIVVDPHE